MARENVEKFLADYAKDKNKLKTNYGKDRRKAVKGYAGLSDDEQELLIRGDAHEIKLYLKDVYGASLSVNIP